MSNVVLNAECRSQPRAAIPDGGGCCRLSYFG
jgi:hypothetical protein